MALVTTAVFIARLGGTKTGRTGEFLDTGHLLGMELAVPSMTTDPI